MDAQRLFEMNNAAIRSAEDARRSIADALENLSEWSLWQIAAAIEEYKNTKQWESCDYTKEIDPMVKRIWNDKNRR